MINKYKPSYYNYPYEGKNGKFLLYNTFTGALVNVLNKDQQVVRAFLESPNDTILRDTNSSTFEKMVACGFIITETTNELDLLRFRQMSSRFQEFHALTLTIIPTRACNFRCVYCFEEVKSGKMSKKDIKDLLQFVKGQIDTKKIRGISVTWYGGEPLLAFEEIKEISQALINLCKTKKIDYRSSIVTNAYLLDEKKAKELIRLKIADIQICLDGNKETHDKRRVLANGGPTFERIKNGFLTAKKYFKGPGAINLRMNVDKGNADDVEQLLKEDWLYGDNVQIRLGPLRHYSSECSAWDPKQMGFTMEEFYQYHKRVSDLLAQKGVKLQTDLVEAPVKGFYCGAQLIGCYAITPGGEVFKCISALNAGDEVGALKDGKFLPNNNYVNWFLRDASHEELCSKCVLLPTCLGGCPTIRKNIKDRETLKAAVCGYAFASLDNWLRIESEKLPNQ